MNYFFYFLLGYILIINLISVIVTIADKIKAMLNKWRVKEKTLLLLSALGGSVGMYITMLIIRHKTRHLKFMLGIPVIFIIQCILAFFIWRSFYG
jgi:uncharacterized membrane protein YsdA (DUF1294 family)